MQKKDWIYFGLLSALVAMPAIAADSGASLQGSAQKATTSGITEYATDPEPIADAIVIYTPMADHALEKMEASERVLTGRIDSLQKGKNAQMVIVHKANTMIRSLKAGEPVKVYLKRFPDRDAYYPIAIFSVTKG